MKAINPLLHFMNSKFDHAGGGRTFISRDTSDKCHRDKNQVRSDRYFKLMRSARRPLELYPLCVQKACCASVILIALQELEMFTQRFVLTGTFRREMFGFLCEFFDFTITYSKNVTSYDYRKEKLYCNSRPMYVLHVCKQLYNLVRISYYNFKSLPKGE